MANSSPTEPEVQWSPAAKQPGPLRFFDWLWRLPLGLVFIYAALEKIIDPEAFALVIDNYRLLPQRLVAPVALTLPWLELWAGVLVLIGLWKRAAALILAGLLTAFLVAVSYNLYRGLDFECGCFGSGSRQAGIDLLWQDGLLLVCALGLVFKRPRRPRR